MPISARCIYLKMIEIRKNVNESSTDIKPTLLKITRLELVIQLFLLYYKDFYSYYSLTKCLDMKKRTFATLITVALFICIQIVYARKPAPPPGDCSIFTGRCDDPKIEMWEPCGFSKYELRYSTNYPEIVTYHGAGPIKQLSQLINSQTVSLPATRRSYMNISVSGTWCSGAVGCRVDRPDQLTFDPLGTINQIKLVRTFSCRGGKLRDMKIVANSIKMTNGQRVIWTKTYPADIVPAFLEMETDPDKAPIVGYAVVQHTDPVDSLDGWFQNPVYDSGDYIGNGGGGGGGSISPAPCDSILL